jgi:hypothetical protein
MVATHAAFPSSLKNGRYRTPRAASSKAKAIAIAIAIAITDRKNQSQERTLLLARIADFPFTVAASVAGR